MVENGSSVITVGSYEILENNKRYALTETAKCSDEEIVDGTNQIETVECDTRSKVVTDLESLEESNSRMVAIPYERTEIDIELTAGYLSELNSELIYGNDIPGVNNNYNIANIFKKAPLTSAFVEYEKDTEYNLDDTGWGIENAYAMLYSPVIEFCNDESLPSAQDGLYTLFATIYQEDNYEIIEGSRTNSSIINDNPNRSIYNSSCSSSAMESASNTCLKDNKVPRVIDLPEVEQNSTLSDKVFRMIMSLH